MHRSYIIPAMLIGLLGLAAVMLGGCGGAGTDSGSGLVSGTATTTLATRAPGDVQYVPTADCTVYAVNMQTGVRVTAQIHSNADGGYTLMNVPKNVGIEIVAEKNLLHLRARLMFQPGERGSTQELNPDTTIACSLADQLEAKGCASNRIAEMYSLSLAYQGQNRFKYGHCNGLACDMTDPDDIALTARECLTATVNEHLRLAIQLRSQDRCRPWINSAMCDAVLNCACPLALTDQQRTRLATRACDGGVWTEAEAADLLTQAGITLDGGGAVVEADVVQTRTRLRARFAALVQPKLCAAEMLMLCTQSNDATILFHARNQQQLDDLIDLIAPEL